MCGRFTVSFSEKDLKNLYNISSHIIIEPNYNVTPLSNIPVIIRNNESEQLELELMQWGLIPSWSKDPSLASKMINARAETIDTKPSFKKCFLTKRCIIPITGFYEWHTTTKQPYYIKPKEGLFLLAGIWEEWKDPLGRSIQSCTIITTDANFSLKDIHNRRPVIVEDKELDIWFNPFTDQNKLKQLLKPFYNERLEYSEVSKRVNTPSNNDASLIELLR